MIQYAPELTSEERGRLKRAKKEARQQKEEEEYKAFCERMTRQEEEKEKQQEHKKWCVTNEWRNRREYDLENDRLGKPREIWSCQRHWDYEHEYNSAAKAAAAAAAAAAPASRAAAAAATAATAAAATPPATSLATAAAAVPGETAAPTRTSPATSEGSEGDGKHWYFAEDGAQAEGSFSLGLVGGDDSNGDENSRGMEGTAAEGAEAGAIG